MSKKININWTTDKEDAILTMIEDWVHKHEVTCGENVQQCNEPAIDAVNIMADIVDIIFAD